MTYRPDTEAATALVVELIDYIELLEKQRAFLVQAAHAGSAFMRATGDDAAIAWADVVIGAIEAGEFEVQR